VERANPAIFPPGVIENRTTAMNLMESRTARFPAPLSWTGRPIALGLSNGVTDATRQTILSAGWKVLSAVRLAVFPALWLFIGAVSSYDAYLTIKYEDSIAAMELNPLGQYLLQQNDGDAALFMAMKFVGTIVVLGVLNLIHRARPQWGLWMTGSVATFQGGLLGFLSL
jgi:hypothetical protein